MKVGAFGERVNAAVLDMSGLFEEGSVGALQNFSEHGVDVFGKERFGSGKWLAFEMKSSFGKAPGLSPRQLKGPDVFSRDILTKAVVGGKFWVPGQSAAPSMKTWALQIRRDMVGETFSGYVVKNNFILNRPQPVNVDVAPWPNPLTGKMRTPSRR